MADPDTPATRDPSIDVLKDRIARRLAEIGISERAASMAATGKPDAIRHIRARDHVPSYDRLFSIARALQTSPEFLLGQADNPEERSERYTRWEAARQITQRPLRESAPFDRHIGVFSVQERTQKTYVGQNIDVWWINMAGETDILPRPIFRGHRDRQIIAVECPFPLIGCGSTIIVEPSTRVRLQESALIQFKRNAVGWEGPTGCVPHICGMIIRRTESEFVLQTPLSKESVRVQPDDVIVHRIMPLRELLDG